MWIIFAELVTIVSSYGRGGKNYFHLMSWQPDVFHLCFFLAPMQHFATLSSTSALYGRDKIVPRQLDESLCGRCPHKGRPAHAPSHAPRHHVTSSAVGATCFHVSRINRFWSGGLRCFLSVIFSIHTHETS